MKWITDNIDKLKGLEGEYKKTGELIQQNMDKLKRVFVSVNKKGKITDLSDKIKNLRSMKILP